MPNLKRCPGCNGCNTPNFCGCRVENCFECENNVVKLSVTIADFPESITMYIESGMTRTLEIVLEDIGSQVNGFYEEVFVVQVDCGVPSVLFEIDVAFSIDSTTYGTYSGTVTYGLEFQVIGIWRLFILDYNGAPSWVGDEFDTIHPGEWTPCEPKANALDDCGSFSLCIENTPESIPVLAYQVGTGKFADPATFETTNTIHPIYGPPLRSLGGWKFTIDLLPATFYIRYSGTQVYEIQGLDVFNDEYFVDILYSDPCSGDAYEREETVTMRLVSIPEESPCDTPIPGSGTSVNALLSLPSFTTDGILIAINHDSAAPGFPVVHVKLGELLEAFPCEPIERELEETDECLPNPSPFLFYRAESVII